MEEVYLKIRFVTGEHEDFVASESYFQDSWFHARDAKTGEMVSYPVAVLAMVVSKTLTPTVTTKAPEMFTPPPASQGMFARGAEPPAQHAPQNIEREFPLPPGAVRVSNETLAASIRIPPAPPNLSAFGLTEARDANTIIDPIREAVAMRRMRTPREG